MKTFTASSGAEIQIGVAGWEATIRLKNAIFRELAKTGLDVKGLKLSKDLDISGLINSFLAVESSPEVYDALWPCLEKSLYNSKKITKATFEPEEARQDYYEILLEFLKVNITPFLPKVALKLSAGEKMTLTGIQKSA